MIILDSDHLSFLEHSGNQQSRMLEGRLTQVVGEPLVTTIVSFEEQMRGWLAAMARARRVHDQPLYYTRLAGLVQFFGRWELLPFDEPAADRFESLRSAGVRIGTMDLKIASIALVQDATLLSANLRDFEKVPGLKVEDWLH